MERTRIDIADHLKALQEAINQCDQATVDHLVHDFVIGPNGIYPKVDPGYPTHSPRSFDMGHPGRK